MNYLLVVDVLWKYWRCIILPLVTWTPVRRHLHLRFVHVGLCVGEDHGWPYGRPTQTWAHSSPRHPHYCRTAIREAILKRSSKGSRILQLSLLFLEDLRTRACAFVGYWQQGRFGQPLASARFVRHLKAILTGMVDLFICTAISFAVVIMLTILDRKFWDIYAVNILCSQLCVKVRSLHR